MTSGKIPLLPVESLETVLQHCSALNDFFVMFLRPASQAEYAEQLRTSLSEPPSSLARYAKDARKQAQDVLDSGIYDTFLQTHSVNDAVDTAIHFTKALRPDLFKEVNPGASQATGIRNALVFPSSLKLFYVSKCYLMVFLLGIWETIAVAWK